MSAGSSPETKTLLSRRSQRRGAPLTTPRKRWLQTQVAQTLPPFALHMTGPAPARLANGGKTLVVGPLIVEGQGIGSVFVILQYYTFSIFFA